MPLSGVSIDVDESKKIAIGIVLPPGQQVPVRTMAPLPGTTEASASTPALAKPSRPASSIDALPVRFQADSRVEALAGQPSTAVLVPSDEGEFWHATVQQLIRNEAIAALVRELALQSQLVARDTDQWLLRVERESLNQSGTRDRLMVALAAAGHGVRLVVEVGRVTDSPARRNAAAAAERQLAAEKVIFEDPFVQSMMRDFGAKIVPGTIKPG
jgi:DNA polymerase-3 subunit gamma/tau